jgi:hypothetical protein
VYFVVPIAIPSIVQYFPTAALAVYSPPEVIDPHAAVHVTGALAVNCCVCPCGVIAETGVITIGDTTEGFVVAVWPPLVAVAVMVQTLGYRGALNNPVDEIEPQSVAHVAPLPAVNCCVAPSSTVGFAGVIANPPDVVVSEANAV